ncbi:radical SAM protein [Algiphilus sp.]|uniref:radical SAM protein n=1 Tax=Algiphilus sp. TaxID=1872431 RepID=UPI003CCB7B2D
MSKLVLKDAHVEINSVDLSNQVQSVTINYGAELPEDTSMGDNTRSRLPGLKDWSLEITFHQNFAAGNVDATLFPLVGADAFAVKVRSTSAAVGATNPSYEGNALLESYQPIGNSVGEVATAPVTIQGDGTLSRVTS